MKITINQNVFREHPKFMVGCILVRGADSTTTLEQSQHLLRETEKLIRMTFHKETIKNHDMISPWAVAQAEFGKAARHYHTSVERLLKRVLSGKHVTGKHPALNVARGIALKHVIPVGVDDVDKIEKDLTFSMATGKERAGVLRTLKQGALYYKDGKSPLGTKLDHWKSPRTKLTPDSENVLIHFDALPPITRKQLNDILAEAKASITAFCGGKVKTFILSSSKRSVNL